MLSDVTYYQNIVEMSKDLPSDWDRWVPLASRLRAEVNKVSMCGEWSVVNGKKKSGWIQEELVDPKEEMRVISAVASHLVNIATDDGGGFDEIQAFRGLYTKANRLALVMGISA